MKKGIILMAAFGIILSHEAHGGQREDVAVRCAGGDVEAVVTEELVLRVTRAGEVVHEREAEERTIEAGPVYHRTGYSTGRVIKGGADLRVITKHVKNPAVAGHAHLSMRLDGKSINAPLRCSVY